MDHLISFIGVGTDYILKYMSGTGCGVIQAESSAGKYLLYSTDATAACQYFGGDVAFYDDLMTAVANNCYLCRCGWVRNNNGNGYQNGYGMSWRSEACGNKTGFIDCSWRSTVNAHCINIPGKYAIFY